jgi:hypothetical protein
MVEEKMIMDFGTLPERSLFVVDVRVIDEGVALGRYFII